VVDQVSQAAITSKTRVIDIDLRSYFDTIAHAKLFPKISERVNDKDIVRIVKLIVKAGGKRGIAQGDPFSPLMSNIYLSDVDKMLEKTKEVSKRIEKYDRLVYARWNDDLIILMDGQPKWQWNMNLRIVLFTNAIARQAPC
jgi:RNA-directed DNA polymerase